MIVPLRVTRPVSMEAVTKALEADERLCFLVAQKNANDDEPGPGAFYRTGTIGMIMRMRKLSEGGLKVLVQGLCRARISRFVSESPCYRVRIDRIDDRQLVRSVSLEALLRSVRQNIDKLSGLGKTIQPELSMVVQSVDDPGRMADLVSSNLTLKVTEAQDLLELDEPVQRLTRVNQTLEKEIGILEVQSQIQNKAREEMSKTQRDYYLREQLRQIKSELGDGDVHGEEVEELRAKIVKAGLPDEAKIEADKQVRRLDQMHSESAEAGVLRTYVDWLVELPWNTASQDTLDIETARKILDEDHYDLEHIKDRILDYLAVRKLRVGAHGPILCLLGPPGVGKTSLGRSIARALGRKFVRISLGGVRDEAEIRGHRRTYVGAMPGRFIQALKQAGTNNPVLLLDEVDKLGADVRGDPSAALLEVLDPEQNHTFRDHYLGVAFDLSKVLFIATANQPETIPPPLRDRMETLRLSGYSEEEKLVIAERYLVPKQITEAGLTATDIVIGRDVIRRIVSEYTREAGLRELERLVAQLARKIARRVVEQQAARESGRDGGPPAGTSKRARGGPVIDAEDVTAFLGPPRYLPGERRAADEVGTVNGLAWTPYGGEVLHIEAQTMAGKGSLTLTGQLGDVMKESAQAALSFARAYALTLGLGTEFYANREIHIHVPSGAVPKDGPSAGVAMACSLVSLISGIPVRHDVAMTGELTLRGKVLPIGGLKEKLLAAARMGITTVIIPAGNAHEIAEIPPHVLNKLTVKPVHTVDEALEIALARRPHDKKDTDDSGPDESGKHKIGGRTRKNTRSGMA
ncbi:MAG: ATP-dependent proteinase, Serine peptidase family [Myxococcales bacterium]|nr:ATP-dependent proteinase, Serine peptidase family [Myxococcales bacterium]